MEDPAFRMGGRHRRKREKKEKGSPSRRGRRPPSPEKGKKAAEMLNSPYFRRQILKHMTSSTKDEALRARRQKLSGSVFPAYISAVRVTGHNQARRVDCLVVCGGFSALRACHARVASAGVEPPVSTQRHPHRTSR
jgi:hypothetical protein